MLIQALFILLFWVFVIGFGVSLVHQSLQRHVVQERLFRDEYESQDALKKKIRNTPIQDLVYWLKGAGFERVNHVVLYAVMVLAFIILGFVVTGLLNRSPLIPLAASALLSIPGQIGEVFMPIILLCPYVIGIMIALIPYVYVRNIRARRQTEVEQDLPIFLEFLVTLSSAGIAFDEALMRVLKVFKANRPIPIGFSQLQKEILAGQSRLYAFWNLRDRLQTSSVRNFVSALIQSEKRGGSINEILRQQMQESTNRRRFKAMEMTTTLPVKLLFPMMVCFLPGIFLITLGPVLHEFISVVDTVLGGLR